MGAFHVTQADHEVEKTSRFRTFFGMPVRAVSGTKWLEASGASQDTGGLEDV
jgi:hypothetical protein